MSRGPFYNVKEVYRLDFGSFIIGSHLRRMSKEESEVRGLNVDDMNLEAHFCDPKEGNPNLRHDMKAVVTPAFDGLKGTFTYKAKPESRLLPVVKAIGVKVEGVFAESADSVDDSEGWEDWTLRRFIASEEQTDSISEDGTWTSLGVIRLSFVTTKPADELDLLAPDAAEVVANIGTLKKGDLVSHPVRGTYQVRGNPVAQGEYERARIEKG
jgi:hypothetical protein